MYEQFLSFVHTLPVNVVDVLALTDIVVLVLLHLDILAIALSFHIANIVASAGVDSVIKPVVHSPIGFPQVTVSPVSSKDTWSIYHMFLLVFLEGF